MQFGNSINDQLGVLFNFVAEGNRHKANMLNQALQEYQMGAQYKDDNLRNTAFNKIGDLNRTPIDRLFHMIGGKDRPASHVKTQQELPAITPGEIIKNSQAGILNELDKETGDRRFSQFATMIARDPSFAQKYGANENQSELQGYKQFIADQNIEKQTGTLNPKMRQQYEKEIMQIQSQLDQRADSLSDKQLAGYDKEISRRQDILNRDEEVRRKITIREEAKALAKGGERLRKDYDFSKNTELVRKLDEKGLYRDRLEGSESDMRQQNYDMAIAMHEYYKGQPKMQRLIEERWKRGEESIDGYWGINTPRNRSLFEMTGGTGQSFIPEPMVIEFIGADGKRHQTSIAMDKRRINDINYLKAEIRNQIADPDLREVMLKNARVVAKRSAIAEDEKERLTRETLQSGELVEADTMMNRFKTSTVGQRLGLKPEMTIKDAVQYGDAFYDIDPATGKVFRWSADGKNKTQINSATIIAEIKKAKGIE